MLVALVAIATHVSIGLPSGHLAYLSGTDLDDRTLCVVDLSTSTHQRVGNGRRDGAPCWSPDGEWIAYTTNGEEGVEVRILRPDGTGSKAVSQAHTWNESPRWSPDGKRLAYAGGEGLQKTIMVYDLVSGEEQAWGGGHPGLLRPTWLPRNDLLLLLTSEDSAWAEQIVPVGADIKTTPALLAMGIVGLPGAFTTDIFVATPFGAAPLPPTVLPSIEPREEWCAEPAFDGKALAFESNDGGDREIFVLTKRGAADVSNHHAADWNPVWSPDSRWLAFESFRDGMRGIYRISRDAVRVIPVAVDANADCWDATWSSDGQHIAYVSNRDGDPSIYITAIEGGGVEALMDAPGEELAPAWSPREGD